ncbi:MAG: OmpA family protein, partial [Proteobacteria bacterium]|nr:OmpA family protein [Pseudomonadota bacterium]
MKAKYFLKVFGVLILAVFLTSCASMTKEPPQNYICAGQDLNPMVERGEYVKKVDNFLVILDTSSTMSERQTISWYKKQQKFLHAKDLITCMNQTIPGIELNGGIRVFGKVLPEEGLIYGMTGYTKAGVDDGLASIEKTGGFSPITESITLARTDLEETTGKTAVILFSDGKNTDGSDPVAAAKEMKGQFGDDICIYTVLLGESAKGKAVMDGIAEVGKCDFTIATDAKTLISTNAMTDFVVNVFLKKGAKVRPPVDIDGDGITDSIDKCPETPGGIKVDKVGCPIPIKEKISITLHIEFDFDKDDVRPEYNPQIEEVANFLKAYPDKDVSLEGHTDSEGSDAYNDELSKRRAESVKNVLIETFGIDAA